MAFEATKKEWCELYTFFRLLAVFRTYHILIITGQ